MEPHRQPQDRQHARPRRPTRRSSATTSRCQGLRRRPGRQGDRDVGPEGRRRLHARGHADLRRSPTSSTSLRTRRSRRCRRSSSRAASTTTARRSPFGDMPIGNGPFKMSEPWKHDQYIKIVAQRRLLRRPSPTSTASTSRSSRTRTPPTPSSRPATSTSRRSVRARSRTPSPSTASRENGYTVNPGKQVLLGAENATYYLDRQQRRTSASRTRTSARRSRWRSTARRSATSSSRAPATRPTTSSRRASPATQTGAWADAKYDEAAAKQALADAGFPSGKGLADDQAVVQQRRRSREDHGARPGRPGKAIGVKATFDSADFAVVPQEARRRQVPDRPSRLDRRLPDHGQLPVSAVHDRSRRQQVASTATRPSTTAIATRARSTDGPLRASQAYQDDRTRRSARTSRSPRSCSTSTTTLARVALNDFTYDPQALR